MSKIVKHNMRWEAVMMDSELAQDLLDRNHPSNRSPKLHKIEQYARDMRNGQWELHPHGIMIDTDNYTIDGQNRLAAVIRSGCEVPMFIIYGCKKKMMKGVDMGSNRNFSDYVKIGEIALPFNQPFNVSSVVRAMDSGLRSKPNMSNAEVINFVGLHEDALKFTFEAMPKNAKGITHASVRAVIARAYYKRNYRTRIRQFCTMLYDGLVENPKDDSGVIRLRNWLIETFLGGMRKATVSRPRPVIVYAKTERALQAFLDNENIAMLYETRTELFPLPGEKDAVEETEEPEESLAEANHKIVSA